MSTNNGTDDLPARVRTERKRRGWTQEEMAARAGMSVRAYQNFEGRKGSPQGENLRAILRAVEIDEVGEMRAQLTREGWTPPIAVFLDMMGAYLSTLDEDTALDVMQAMTRDAFARQRRTT